MDLDYSNITLSILDSAGQILPAVKSILQIARDMELAVSTGHLPVYESLKLAREAQKIGFSRLIFCHPLSHSISASLKEIEAMADYGAFIELAALNAFSPGSSLRLRKKLSTG